MSNTNFSEKKQLALFDTVAKIEQSTASVTELRVPIFAPVQKLSGNSTTAQAFKKNGGIRVIETSWGKVEIRGRKLLTQVHRDLLDCVYTHASSIQYKPDGDVVMLFSQSKILREYSADKSDSYETNTKWLREKIEEIRDVTVKFEDGSKRSADFNLIKYLDYDNEASSYCITLDKRYLRFYEQELSIGYKRELPKLLKVDSALIRAIIRWFFTHKRESKYKLITVLEALGFPIESPKSLQVAKRDIKDRIPELLTFGIDYDPEEGDGFFYYRGNENVSFIPSLFKNSSTNKLPIEIKISSIEYFIGKKFITTDNKIYTILKIDFDVDLTKAIVLTEEGGDLIINISSSNEIDAKKEVYKYLDGLFSESGFIS
jgi:hypothetical protein